MSVETVWQEALHYIQGKVPKQVYETWFTPVHLDRIEDSTAHIGVPNKFFGDWLGTHYGPLLAEAVSSARGGGDVAVSFMVFQKSGKPAAESVAALAAAKTATQTKARRGIQLNPKYTFKNFVVGAGNQFAHAACMAVAEQPGKAYNPLFIYGGEGLGKTHLLNAIGNHVAERTDLRIAYLTTEQFTNEVINSIRYDKMTDLRKRYRHIDMLMIDDIQFLAGKERSQEEFFHTFNSLHAAGNQIVISSDRPPKQIPRLEDRLRTRLEWGLITDVSPPEFETRLAILRMKAESEGLDGIPPGVLDFIASNISDNVRELEGALIRVAAYSSLNRAPLTEEIARQVLTDILPPTQPRIITPELILDETAKMFGFTVEDLCGKSRRRPLVIARQIGMYCFREMTDYSYPRIAEEFGGRDHTTVIHAVEKVKALMTERHIVFDQVNELMGRIRLGTGA